jgi:hypothetical protein
MIEWNRPFGRNCPTCRAIETRTILRCPVGHEESAFLCELHARSGLVCYLCISVGDHEHMFLEVVEEGVTPSRKHYRKPILVGP